MYVSIDTVQQGKFGELLAIWFHLWSTQNEDMV